ncbi:hypothetical protein MKY30_20495 [Oceanobacillus sp. FSL W8-0428]|uniref:hypothetical protein n=1 Tax=Oceanobacillus sp. FSL W8-0428 TaxID=2921715 RepID=UPI0030FA4232
MVRLYVLTNGDKRIDQLSGLTMIGLGAWLAAEKSPILVSIISWETACSDMFMLKAVEE